MANVPYPLTGESTEELKLQIWELIRQVFEEKIGGADLGDVFSMPGDVLTLVLAASSGLTKSGNELAVDPSSTGGLQVGSTGVGIKLDGATLTLSASGLRITTTYNMALYELKAEKDAASGYAGLNASSRVTKGVDTTDDVIVDLATKGLVLKDTQVAPHYWRVTISNVGAIVTTDLGDVKP